MTKEERIMADVTKEEHLMAEERRASDFRIASARKIEEHLSSARKWLRAAIILWIVAVLANVLSIILRVSK